MLFLDISLVAFLLQENYCSSVEALLHTFLDSGIAVVVDILLKAIYVFGFGVPLFIDGGTRHTVKWGLWLVHKSLLTAVYGFILFVHLLKMEGETASWVLLVLVFSSSYQSSSFQHVDLSVSSAARPTFYDYIIVMFAINSAAWFACTLAVMRAGLGIWLSHPTAICYHSLYLPFLYATFLADFFRDEDFLLDYVYYSEIKDAGFFDDDLD